jgi:MFS family permease
MAIFAAAPFLGPVLGPVVGGFLSQYGIPLIDNIDSSFLEMDVLGSLDLCICCHGRYRLLPS